MFAAETLQEGALLRAKDFVFLDESNGIQRADVVDSAIGAEKVALQVFQLPAGATWIESSSTERILVVFSGSGTASLQSEENHTLVQGSTIYAPSGQTLRIEVSGAAGMTVYQWTSELPSHATLGQCPKSFGTLWDAETQLQGFGGVSGTAPKYSARMNFIFWPGVGTPRLSLHCGIQESGQTFNVHTHEESEEAFIVFEGNGQMYLRDRWYDVAPGDVLFAPPGIPHGARNADNSVNARRFVTCGGPTPFDPQLYKAAGVSAEVI